MRKSRILSLLLAVAVTVTMLVAVPLTASAASATWPTDDIYAIGHSCKIIANDYNGEFPSDGLTGVTKDKLIAAYKAGYASNKITVDGTPYNNAFNVKGIGSRSFAIKVKTGCTVTIYGATHTNGYMAIITDHSSDAGDSDLADVLTAGKCTQNPNAGEGYYTSTYQYDGDTEQVLYISSYSPTVTDPTKKTNDAKVNCIDIKYTKPLIDIGYDFYLDKEDESSKPLEVTTENMEPKPETINWKSENQDAVTLSGESNTSATVTAIGEPGTESKITASCTYNDTTYTASCIAKIGSKQKDVIIKGCSGLKSVTLTKQGEPDTTFTAKWERTTLDGGSVASVANNDDLGGEDYKQTDRGFLRTIPKVPIGEYDVTYTFADEYYEDSGKNPKTLNIEISSEYSAASPAITVSSKNIEVTKDVNSITNNLAGKIIKWDFTTAGDNYNNYLSIQDTPTTYVYPNDTKDVFMEVKTRGMASGGGNGKFTSDQSGDRVQINEGATLTVPVIKGSIVTVVTVSTPSGTNYITIDGNEITTAKGTYVATKDGTVEIKCTNGDYIKTITIASVFGGTTDTDYGLYTDADQQLGVIRFFQSFVENAAENAKVDEYGFYFLNKDGDPAGDQLKTVQEGDIDYVTFDGMYGDLIGIAKANFTDGAKFYAKPFVKIGNEIIYGNSIECEVKDPIKNVDKPQE